MRTATIFGLLACTISVFSIPVADLGSQGSLAIGAAVLEVEENVDRKLAVRAPSLINKTTQKSMNPTVPPTTTTTTTTTTTSLRPTTTTTRTTTTTTTTRTTTRPTTTTTRTTTRPTTTTTRTTTRTSTTTTNPPGSTQTIDVTGYTYINALLTAHNVHRPNHSVPNLVWNARLANIAAEIASNCVYAHNTTAGGGGYGQNIGAGAAGNAGAGLINNLMYNGEINNYPKPYGNNNPDMSGFGGWGHYSQLVWADTTDVGCATQYCPQGLKNTNGNIRPYFLVCNYSPPGNYLGQFSKVPAPLGRASVVIIGQ